MLSRFLTRLVCFILLLDWHAANAQVTHTGGIVNIYTKVNQVDYCNNTVNISNTSGFFVGQKVMLMQMKGAGIYTANDIQYGTITDYGSSGNYEIAKIKNITGNDVEFEHVLLRKYDPLFCVQLISLPEYQTLIIDSTLRAQKWDGNTGGVLLVKADSIILNANIDLKGCGFKGALLENDGNAQACYNGGNGGAFEYFCGSIYCGAPKGEGNGNTPYPYGRGKNGNGGGGGNDHNTGGGGGSNYGAGGRGGLRLNVSQFSCPGPGPGEGGQALDYNNASNKIFMGGGGGAGDENNNEGTGGADGGGICILIADVLLGNAKKINANGNAQTLVAQSDGAGGGGAGGTILLDVNNIPNTLYVDANGGNGGSLDNGGSQTYCFGPGGGAGGGALWLKVGAMPPSIVYKDTGGISGKNVFGLAPATCPTGSTNAAQAGSNGGVVTGLVIPEGNVPFEKLVASACCDTTVCTGAEVLFKATGSGLEPITFSWSNGRTDSTFIEPASNTTTYSVTVTDSIGCELIRAIQVNILNNPPDISFCCDTTVCAGSEVWMSITNNSGATLTYAWNTGSSTNSTTATVYNTQNFAVTATDQSGCVVIKSGLATVPIVSVQVMAQPDTAVLQGQQVQLTALSDTNYNFHWSPTAGLSNTGIYNPVATPDISTTYCVTVTDQYNCTADACHAIELVIPDLKIPDAFSPNGDGVNDLFTIFPLKYAEVFEIRIYNRWGEVVFETTGNTAWDGTYKGRLQNAGAYVCCVSYGSPLAPGKSKLVTKDIILLH
ncbi:MAG: gliding motility-associated C-terminal domain-containing protein [Chitinophagales bacterium]